MYWDEELHEAISLHEKSINISPDLLSCPAAQTLFGDLFPGL